MLSLLRWRIWVSSFGNLVGGTVFISYHTYMQYGMITKLISSVLRNFEIDVDGGAKEREKRGPKRRDARLTDNLIYMPSRLNLFPIFMPAF